MNYADAFYHAQIGELLMNAGGIIIAFSALFLLVLGLAIAQLDNDLRPLRRPFWITVSVALVGTVLAITGALIPSHDTIVATAIAEHGIDKAERMMTLLEGLGK